MELWPRLIHAAIGRLSLTFFGQSLRFFFFFFFPQTHFEPYHPLKSRPITVHLLSHPPSLRSEAVTLAVHLRSKTLASPSISNLNLRLTLHLRSKTLTSPSISDLNLRLTLHLRSKTLVSPSISDLNRHSPSLQSQPSPHPPLTISPSPSPSISDLNPRLTLHVNNNNCFETYLRLWLLGFSKSTSNSVSLPSLALSILLALPKTPSNSVTNCQSFLFLWNLTIESCFDFFFFFCNYYDVPMYS